MKALIVAGLALTVVLGGVQSGIAGPAAGPAFGTRSREALDWNLDQQQPYHLTGTEVAETSWRLERRSPVSTHKRPSAFEYVRGEDDR